MAFNNKTTEDRGELKLLRWIAFDSSFPPGKIDLTYKHWTRVGITALCTITKENKIMSFQEVKDTFGVRNSDLFRYLQMRDYYDKKVKKKDGQIHPLIKVIVTSYRREIPKAISTLYSILMDSRQHSTLYVKTKWEKEIGEEISDETWLEMWKWHQTTTQSQKWREFTWKNQICYFITPLITSRQLSTQQICWRQCGEITPNHTHVFWSCRKVEPFWREVHADICWILGYGIPFSCRALYLGELEEWVTKEDQCLVKIILAASKKTITKNWLKIDRPSTKQWLSIVEEIKEMEKLTYKLKIKEELFVRNWVKWPQTEL